MKQKRLDIAPNLYINIHKIVNNNEDTTKNNALIAQSTPLCDLEISIFKIYI